MAIAICLGAKHHNAVVMRSIGDERRLKGLEAVTIKSKRKTAMVIAVFDVLIV